MDIECVRRACPLFQITHTPTHKHKKSLSEKAAQLLLCKLVRACVGNSNLWAHNLLNLELPTTWCSVLHTTKQHPHTLTHTLTHHSLYLSPLTILLPSIHHTHNYKQHQQLHYIITAPVDSTIRTASVLLASPLTTCSYSSYTTAPLHYYNFSTLHSQFH